LTGKRQREDALATMRAVNPATATELREALDEDEVASAMRRAITAGSNPSQPIPPGDRVANELAGKSGRSVLRPGRRGLALGAGLACVAAVAALVVFSVLPGGGRSGPAYAAAAIEVAEANPRLLITQPGWSVTRADQFEADSGEVTFSDGAHDLSIVWYPARFYDRYLRDRADVSTPVHSTLLGRDATTVHYGREENATMLAPEGSVFLEIRSMLGSKEAYDAVLSSLRPVDVDTWLAAMPASVVRPEDRAAAVEVALRGVPLPPDFDRAALEQEDTVRDRYAFAIEVASAVACGWVESWLAAKRAGDQKAVDAAVRAMSTAAAWPLMQGREVQRGWAMNLEYIAKEVARDDLNVGPAGSVVHPDGSGYELGPAWSLALGCKPPWRRPIER
jgi:hypothetical protein